MNNELHLSIFSCTGLKARARKDGLGLILFLCLCSLAFSLSAQIKYEREYRISEEDVPKQALAFIQKATSNKKIKWYREEGIEGWTIEAKTKIDGQLYSIEFDSLGNLEDYEIKIRWKDLPDNEKTLITRPLSKDFIHFKIRRIQFHHKAPFSDVPGPPSFEIVVKGKTAEGYVLMEYLFSPEGEVIRKDRILLRNTDNLEY